MGSLAAMSLLVSVRLLLLPLLLTSAVGYVYQQLDQASPSTWSLRGSWYNGTKATEADCSAYCDSSQYCVGYTYNATDNMCELFNYDCRGPAVNSERLLTGYMAVNKCPGNYPPQVPR